VYKRQVVEEQMGKTVRVDIEKDLGKTKNK